MSSPLMCKDCILVDGNHCSVNSGKESSVCLLNRDDGGYPTTCSQYFNNFDYADESDDASRQYCKPNKCSSEGGDQPKRPEPNMCQYIGPSLDGMKDVLYVADNHKKYDGTVDIPAYFVGGFSTSASFVWDMIQGKHVDQKVAVTGDWDSANGMQKCKNFRDDVCTVAGKWKEECNKEDSKYKSVCSTTVSTGDCKSMYQCEFGKSAFGHSGIWISGGN